MVEGRTAAVRSGDVGSVVDLGSAVLAARAAAAALSSVLGGTGSAEAGA